MGSTNGPTAGQVRRTAVRVFCFAAPLALVAAILAVWQSSPTRGELGATALIIGLVAIVSGIVSLFLIPPAQ